jgi:hypothetical protein
MKKLEAEGIARFRFHDYAELFVMPTSAREPLWRGLGAA